MKMTVTLTLTVTLMKMVFDVRLELKTGYILVAFFFKIGQYLMGFCGSPSFDFEFDLEV